MKKLVAIGGGEIGRPGKPIETLSIDKEIISLTGKKRPRLLFIPTASKDSEDYIATVKKYYGQKLGCQVDILLLVKAKPSLAQMKKHILSSDIIYVGGGNTQYMLTLWRKLGIDKLLLQAYKRGVVLSGLSAGAICWFKYGTSDSRMMTDTKYTEFIRVTGLGIFPLILSPHHIREPKRKEGLINIIQKSGGIGLALDDYCAIEIIDNNFRIIRSKPIAKAHKVYKLGGKIIYSELPMKKWLSLSMLISK